METSTRTLNKSFIQRIDWRLIFIVLLLFATSCLIINSAMSSGQYGTNFLLKQVLYYAMGFILAIILIFISPKTIRKYVWIVYILGNLSLVGLLVSPESSFTPIINGAKSWYRLGPISVQPSEFMKIILILVLANVVYQHNRFTYNKSITRDFNLLFKIFLTSLVPMGLILFQNDLGTTLVLIAIILGVIIVSGVTWRILAPVFIALFAFGSSVILLMIYKPSIIEKVSGVQTYQFGRINSWLDPYTYSSGDGYHLTESLKAIGSGQIFGKGLNNGEVYIPENHTDFIFSIIGEEFGFIGTIAVLIIFLMLFFHLIKLATTTSHPFNAIFIIGYLTFVLFHVVQNIGMTIQLLPITGIPLPFISYGGSSLWSLMAGIGIILSIYYHEKDKFAVVKEDK
ncbi:FtsW/RodA/SpoVE family cell cycle protein [Mammaliicoccus lentus]|jgi:rod shape determining protein RodA|uniref:FtsW/RodA/SpoVE family cell cycle protein n=1 Tax=Mammaliicoccus lentus TaxID=42858 RepID=A0AAX3W1Q7_MAMLE|nr:MULTISPECIES: FtsW/RodA/SpoVE family cell cycle protein [Mammaliicoccus]MBF0748089.1 rod shape-determining protein RodA [Mammaliicoccus lentus]MBF0794268.1 rod shape-determining protein RodA [Mammaliicoccus lentus]MBW0762178.1 rod shape-determining protein RodA [Mammaliicoccus lentus]MCR1873556.1 rod shape-determining protein RodA [Mammaliicoccus lentus]MEB8092574.1 rod shape-determining protein RodA [Mammaliicoccus lentus]